VIANNDKVINHLVDALIPDHPDHQMNVPAINHLVDALIPDHPDHQINVPALVRYRMIFFHLEPSAPARRSSGVASYGASREYLTVDDGG
jgi:hypothetical protein